MGRNVLSDVLLIVCLCLFCLAIMIGCGGGGGGGGSSGDGSNSSSSSTSSGSSSSSSSGSSNSSSSSGSSSTSSTSSGSSSSSSSSSGGTVSYSWEWRKTGLNNPLAMTSSLSEIALANSGENKVVRFDFLGNRLTDVSDSDFNGIISVANNSLSGNFYVLSSNNEKVVKFSSDWSKLGSWSLWDRPQDISAKFGDYIAVLETSNGVNGWVEVFNTSGTRIYGPWEISGANTANGIALLPSGNSVVIADTNNHRILQYSLSGTYEGTFGSYGTGNGEFDFNYPLAIDVDSNGNIYVADAGNNRFTVYAALFQFKGRYQGTLGTGDGQFRSPYGIAVTPDGSAVYVSNSIGNNLQKYIKNP